LLTDRPIIWRLHWYEKRKAALESRKAIDGLGIGFVDAKRRTKYVDDVLAALAGPKVKRFAVQGNRLHQKTNVVSLGH